MQLQNKYPESIMPYLVPDEERAFFRTWLECKKQQTKMSIVAYGIHDYERLVTHFGYEISELAFKRLVQTVASATAHHTGIVRLHENLLVSAIPLKSESALVEVRKTVRRFSEFPQYMEGTLQLFLSCTAGIAEVHSADKVSEAYNPIEQARTRQIVASKHGAGRIVASEDRSIFKTAGRGSMSTSQMKYAKCN